MRNAMRRDAAPCADDARELLSTSADGGPRRLIIRGALVGRNGRERLGLGIGARRCVGRALGRLRRLPALEATEASDADEGDRVADVPEMMGRSLGVHGQRMGKRFV